MDQWSEEVPKEDGEYLITYKKNGDVLSCQCTVTRLTTGTVWVRTTLDDFFWYGYEHPGPGQSTTDIRYGPRIE